MKINVVRANANGELAQAVEECITLAQLKFGASSSRVVSVRANFVQLLNKQRSKVNEDRTERGLSKITQYETAISLGKGEIDVTDLEVLDFARKLVNTTGRGNVSIDDGLQAINVLAMDWVTQHPVLTPESIGFEQASSILEANAPVFA